MRYYFILLLIFLSFSSEAQERYCYGQIISMENGKALEGCHITRKDLGAGAASDLDGFFRLSLGEIKGDSFSITFEHIGHRTRRIIYELSEFPIQILDGFDLGTIVLSQNVYELPPISIRSESLPEVIYQSIRHSVSDYELLGDRLLLLSYEKRLEKGAKLYLLDEQMLPLDSVSISNTMLGPTLTKDYAGHVYLESSTKMFLVSLDPDELSLSKVNKPLYDSDVRPIVASVNQNYIYSTWIPQYSVFDYYVYSKVDESYRHIHQVADHEMLTMCRAEYKYLNTRDKLKMFRMELETGIEKEVLTCLASFKEGLYYRSLYAPVFSWNGIHYLLDHPGELLYSFNAKGDKLDSIPIAYHQPNKVLGNSFGGEVLMDELTGEIYAVFSEPGGRSNLKRIDKRTGKTELSVALTYDYPECIKVRGGEVFYIYRPFESMQKKFLYKEGLPLRM